MLFYWNLGGGSAQGGLAGFSPEER